MLFLPRESWVNRIEVVLRKAFIEESLIQAEQRTMWDPPMEMCRGGCRVRVSPGTQHRAHPSDCGYHHRIADVRVKAAKTIPSLWLGGHRGTAQGKMLSCQPQGHPKTLHTSLFTKAFPRI